MFSQLVPFIALATLLIPVPSRAVPGAAWVRRQEDAQSSLTLDPAVISTGLEQDGQGDNPEPGQVRSLTSSNNFINFCLPFLDQGVVLTNGAQVVAGSCNQTPMGRIVSLDLAPRSKFVFPPNGDESIAPNTAFTVKMKLLNMDAGNFVNAATNYYAAPQQVNGQGVLIGHTHFVIEPIPSLDTTEPLDPLKFAFFKGINDAVDGNNIVETTVTAGLGAGVYRLCSINTAANHQPALVSNAQHGALDDCSYFTIKDGGNTASASTSASASGTDSASTTAATASVSTTDAAVASASASDSASTTDAASSTDGASSSTDAATDSPQATDAASTTDNSNSDSASSTDDGQSSPTPTPDATTSTDAAAATPTDSSSADNGNGNNGNNGDNGNNGGNNGNNGNNNNNGGDNQNASSSDNASTPAPTDDSSSAAASTDAASTDATPSDAASTDATPSDATPTDDSSAAPTPTDATPSDASPSQGNDNGAGNGDNNNDNQGGDSGADGST